jgi:hypothetical protein
VGGRAGAACPVALKKAVGTYEGLPLQLIPTLLQASPSPVNQLINSCYLYIFFSYQNTNKNVVFLFIYFQDLSDVA